MSCRLIELFSNYFKPDGIHSNVGGLDGSMWDNEKAPEWVGLVELMEVGHQAQPLGW
jgi:hypothetical protein